VNDCPFPVIYKSGANIEIFNVKGNLAFLLIGNQLKKFNFATIWCKILLLTINTDF